MSTMSEPQKSSDRETIREHLERGRMYLERAKARLGLVVPFVLVLILVLLYLVFGGERGPSVGGEKRNVIAVIGDDPQEYAIQVRIPGGFEYDEAEIALAKSAYWKMTSFRPFEPTTQWAYDSGSASTAKTVSAGALMRFSFVAIARGYPERGRLSHDGCRLGGAASGYP